MKMIDYPATNFFACCSNLLTRDVRDVKRLYLSGWFFLFSINCFDEDEVSDDGDDVQVIH